jgi:hypothetical protein
MESIWNFGRCEVPRAVVVDPLLGQVREADRADSSAEPAWFRQVWPDTAEHSEYLLRAIGKAEVRGARVWCGDPVSPAMTATYTFDAFSSLNGLGSINGGDWGGY